MGSNGSKFVTSTVDGQRIVKNLRIRVRNYERRYEIPSAEMAKMLRFAYVRETAEIVKWMQSYHVLGLLKGTTRTTGTPTTITAQSTKSA